MKSFLTLILLCAGLGAMAQTSRQSTTSTMINDDGKTMSIRVEGQVNGRSIDYERKFDVARLSDQMKEGLKQRIFDSLGLGESLRPLAPLTPPVRLESRVPRPAGPHTVDDSGEDAADETMLTTGRPTHHDAGVDLTREQNVTLRCETCTGNVKLEITRSTDDYSVERSTKINAQKRFFPYQLPLPAGEYRLKYFQNDVLQIQSTFTVTAGQESAVVIK